METLALIDGPLDVPAKKRIDRLAIDEAVGLSKRDDSPKSHRPNEWDRIELGERRECSVLSDAPRGANVEANVVVESLKRRSLRKVENTAGFAATFCEPSIIGFAIARKRITFGIDPIRFFAATASDKNKKGGKRREPCGRREAHRWVLQWSAENSGGEQGGEVGAGGEIADRSIT